MEKKKDGKYEILFVGRGGQGLVSAAPIVAQIHLLKNLYVLAFGKFGVERRGAPILAFERSNTKKLNDRWEIERPDMAVFSSEDLLEAHRDLFPHFRENGTVIINTPQSPAQFTDLTCYKQRMRIVTLNATAIALDNGIGNALNPITNTTLVGAVARLLDLPWDLVEQAMDLWVPRKPRNNFQAALQAAENLKTMTINNQKTETPALPPAAARKEYEKYIISITNRDTSENKTGNWRMAGRPVVDYEKCLGAEKCGLCRVYCPDSSVYTGDDGSACFDYDHCKGCGICVRQCPKKALTMKMEVI